MAFEQRLHPRIPDDSKAYIELSGHDEELVWDTINISEGGAAFATECKVEKEMEITMHLMLEEALRGSNLLTLPGTIRSIRTNEDGRHEVGVEFDLVSSEYEELLHHYIGHRRPHRPI